MNAVTQLKQELSMKEVLGHQSKEEWRKWRYVEFNVCCHRCTTIETLDAKRNGTNELQLDVTSHFWRSKDGIRHRCGGLCSIFGDKRYRIV